MSMSTNGVRGNSATAARTAAAKATANKTTDTPAQAKQRAALSKKPYQAVKKQARQAMKQHPGEKPPSFSMGDLIDFLLKLTRVG